MKRDRVTFSCIACGADFDVPRSRARRSTPKWCSLSCRNDITKRYRIDEATGCWIWLGHTDNKGYGGGGSQELGEKKAHRAMYVLHKGAIPAGLQLDHLCRNTSCVNPTHLEPVTNRENAVRAPRIIRARASQVCANGHPWNAKNTYRHPSGSRVCRKCTSIAQARHLERNP